MLCSPPACAPANENGLILQRPCFKSTASLRRYCPKVVLPMRGASPTVREGSDLLRPDECGALLDSRANAPIRASIFGNTTLGHHLFAPRISEDETCPTSWSKRII